MADPELVRSLAEAEAHVRSLTARVRVLEDQMTDHIQRFDTLQTPWWRRVAFWVDGWPWYDLNGTRSWRPWHREFPIDWSWGFD